MGRPSHIRRTLAIVVREPLVRDANEDTPGRRFAEGWSRFLAQRTTSEVDLADDAIKAAGFSAAKAAWEAHDRAVNLGGGGVEGSR